MATYDHNIQTVDAVADLASLGPVTNQIVRTLGYYTPSDGGGNDYRYDSSSSDTIDGGFVIDGPGSVGRFIAIDQTVANAKQFGAKGDGVSDDAFRLNSLFSSCQNCNLSRNIFFVSGQIQIPDGRFINGYGATIDGRSADPNLFPTTELVSVGGSSLIDLGALGANASKGDSVVTLSSPPSLSKGDILAIWDDSAGSYMPSEPTYFKGEFISVKSVSGSDITIAGKLKDNYDSGVRVAHKTSVGASISYLNILAPTSLSSGFGIVAKHVNGLRLNSVHVIGGSYTAISLRRCYNASINQCRIQEDGENTFGTDYGLVLVNCGKVLVSGGDFFAARHAIATGSDGQSDWNVLNRDIILDGCSFESSGELHAADTHANTEDVFWRDCFIRNGLKISGNRISVKGCLIESFGIPAILATSLSGADIDVTTNEIRCGDLLETRGCAFDVGGDGGGIDGNSIAGGVIRFSENRCSASCSSAQTTQSFVRIFNRGLTKDVNVQVSGNHFVNSGEPATFAIRSEIRSGNIFEKITVSGNVIENAGLCYISATGTESAREVHVIGNSCSGGSAPWAAQVYFVTESVVVSSNRVRGSTNGAFLIQGDIAAPNAEAVVSSNSATENNLGYAGSSNSRSFCFIRYMKHIRVVDNFTGADRQRLTVADESGLLLGETVTGSSSGATGVIYSTSTGFVFVKKVTGTFTPTEDINGGTSLVATSMTAALVTMSRNVVALDSDSLWHRDNDNFTTSTNTITNVPNVFT